MLNDKKNLKIGVFGHYGCQNLGDESIIQAVIQNIRQRFPNAKISGFSSNPDDTGERYKIPAFPVRHVKKKNKANNNQEQHNSFNVYDDKKNPIADNDRHHSVGKIKNILKKMPVLWFILKALKNIPLLFINFIYELKFLKRSYPTLKGMDLLMITGSNQFLDNFGGVWGFPYTLLKWTLLAKLAGVKVFFVSVGAGPIYSRASKFLIGFTLLFSDYTSFRDEHSKKLIEAIFFKNKGPVYPDLAHSLLLDDKSSDIKDKLNKKHPVVGINPMPMYDSRYWCLPDDNKYLNYVCKLSAFSSALMREGYTILFFNTMIRDVDVIKDVLERLDDDVRKQSNLDKLVKINSSVNELMDTLDNVDIVVATRFHGTLLSFLAERPVLGVCYYIKTIELMKEMGQEAYSVELDNFEVSNLLKRFKALEANSSKEIIKIKRKNAEYLNKLKKQYDILFDILS